MNTDHHLHFPKTQSDPGQQHRHPLLDDLVPILRKSSPRPRLDHVKAERCRFSASVTAIVTVLACIALLTSGYLAWAGWTSSKVAGCDGGVFDCSHVLTSRWSEVLGVPVGVPAAGLYLVMLIAVVATRSPHRRRRELAVRVIWMLSVTAALVALWFIGLQITSIGRLCPYCLVAHVCGIALAVLMCRRVVFDKATTYRLSGMAITLVAGLIAAQLVSDGPQTYVIEEMSPRAHDSPASGADNEFEAPALDSPELLEEPQAGASLDSTYFASVLFPSVSFMGVVMAPQNDGAKNGAAATPNQTRLVPIMGGTKTLDAHRWPLWGNGASDKIIVEMFDYTCSHCRNTHRAIKEASQQLGGELAVVALPVPLHRSCNDAASSADPQRAGACEIARIAVAVWLVDRTKFTAYHDWLFEQQRSPEEARRHAETLVGSDILARELAKSTASNYVARHVDLYKQAGAGKVPKIMFPTTTVVGEITSGSTLATMVRERSR